MTRSPSIVAVHTVPVTLSARSELAVRGARGGHLKSDFLLVRVTARGVGGREEIGYGEVSATPLWSGEDGTTARHFIETTLAPALIGAPLESLEAHSNTMDRLLAGNPFTKAGIATALWDCWARWLDVPLAVALGGPYRDEIPIKLSLSGDGDALRTVWKAATALGFAAFKVKVGIDLERDVARVALARELVGASTFLGVDANGGWSRADAQAAVRRLQPYDIAFVEQPCAADDLDGLRAVRGAGVPVIADESVFDVADLRRVIAADAADVVSVYIGKSGGPGRALEIGRVASAFGLTSLLGSNGEFGIGAAAQLHVACAMPGLTTEFPSDIIGAHYYDEDVLATPLDSDGTRARLRDAPGLGITLRPDLEAAFE